MESNKSQGIPRTATLDEVQAFFAHDRFATENGARIVEAEYGRAVCEMEITERHLNAQNNVMGGAIFTLADFAFAIACNLGEKPTVGVSNTIEYLGTAKGSRLIAECTADKSGRSLGFYTVEVTDDTGAKIAKMTATCFRRS